ncbi:MAG: erythromycin esterase family protein [Marinilabiliales bacterium]|nr:MAG: erythromycin esterase family protein [Marinilabiliales bacterium]
MRFNTSLKLVPVFISFFLLSGSAPDSGADGLIEYFSRKAVPVQDAGDLDGIIELAGGRKLVLLGEASHGTSEFYSWRADITRRLIKEKGFSFVAVEGDWASIYRLNEYVKGRQGAPSSARRVLRRFDRWPEWMWGNTDIEELAEWLRQYNDQLPEEDKVGFYGMDVYGQWEAMDDLLRYSEKNLSEHHDVISQSMQCFAAYDRDEWVYARAVVGRGHRSCEDDLRNVAGLLTELAQKVDDENIDEFRRAKQNAYVVKNAEDFFRLAVTDNTSSWNSRATHMWETVKRLLSWYGEDARGVVWAHNTHVGDARATVMRYQNMVNIGMLSRQELGHDNVFINGFGTYTGRVNAGSSWGSDMQRMTVPRGMEGSYEYIFGHVDYEQFYLVFDEEDRSKPELNEFRGHRAIGVVYNPRHETGNYVPTILPERYDSFIFIRETSPLSPVR